MNRKIVIFGGSGFVGQYLTSDLADMEENIITTDISPPPIDLPPNVIFSSKDILDEKHIDKVLAGCHTIIFLATSNLRTSIRNPKRNLKVNVMGLLNVLEGARKHNVKKIIYSSASSIYGIPQTLPVNENHPKHPTTVYGIGKYMGEHLLRVYQEMYGIDYFVLRFTNVYGPFQSPITGGLIPVVFSRIINGEEVTIYGDGSQTRDFVYVGDLSRLIKEILVKEDIKNEIVNAGSGVSTSILEVVKACGLIAEIEPNLVYKSQEGGERKGFKADIEKAKKIFGFYPDTPLNTGLKHTFNWLRKQSF